MARYNTGNPIDSAAMKDLSDNAQNLDVLVNSKTALTQTDRLGVERKTWHGMERDYEAAQSSRENQFQSAQSSREAVFSDFIQASGYQDLGEYAPGIEITAHNQYVTFGGQPYLLKPSIPVPYTTSGEWTGDDFKLIGDDSLRQDLANPDMGAALVAYGESNVHDVLDVLINVGNGISETPSNLKEFIGYKGIILLENILPLGKKSSGLYLWDSSKSRELANGLTIIDHDKTDSADVSNTLYLEEQGSGVGHGCFVRADGVAIKDIIGLTVVSGTPEYFKLLSKEDNYSRANFNNTRIRKVIEIDAMSDAAYDHYITVKSVSNPGMFVYSDAIAIDYVRGLIFVRVTMAGVVPAIATDDLHRFAVYSALAGEFINTFKVSGIGGSEAAQIQYEAGIPYLYIQAPNGRLAKVDVSEAETEAELNISTTYDGVMWYQNGSVDRTLFVGCVRRDQSKLLNQFILYDLVDNSVLSHFNLPLYNHISTHRVTGKRQNVRLHKGILYTAHGGSGPALTSWSSDTPKNYEIAGVRAYNLQGELVGETLFSPAELLRYVPDATYFEAEGLEVAPDGTVLLHFIVTKPVTAGYDTTYRSNLIIEVFVGDNLGDVVESALTGYGPSTQQELVDIAKQYLPTPFVEAAEGLAHGPLHDPFTGVALQETADLISWMGDYHIETIDLTLENIGNTHMFVSHDVRPEPVNVQLYVTRIIPNLNGFYPKQVYLNVTRVTANTVKLTYEIYPDAGSSGVGSLVEFVKDGVTLLSSHYIQGVPIP